MVIQAIIFILFPVRHCTACNLLSTLFIMNLFIQINASTSFYAVLFLVPVEALLPLQQRAAVEWYQREGPEPLPLSAGRQPTHQ